MTVSYRYIGNKTRLLEQLIPHISSEVSTGATVVDLMCGTASVAEALRVNKFKVIASDIMTFARHHATVRLLLNASPDFKGMGGANYADLLQELNSIAPREGFFFREFSPDGAPLNGERSRQYFSSANASKIDAISKTMNAWRDSKRITEIENSLLRHDLVLGANRVANIAGTYGHYRSKWNKSAANDLELFPSTFITDPNINHTVIQGAAEDVSSQIQADLCYIDPPYMKRQYAANYHVIETIARGDEPLAVGVSGLREWRDQYSNFCSKVKIRDSFRQIFTSMQCPKFLISYSEDGLLSKNELVELFSEFGSVRVSELNYQRFKSNKGGQGGKLNEYVFRLIKN
ncbi:DNA adenine methylase [Hellea sp.]|nr:DNA adenine methylase [Hellea sp.]